MTDILSIESEIKNSLSSLWREIVEIREEIYKVKKNSKQLCPVCLGHGLVPQGFYLYPPHQETYSSINASPEKCRTCNGVGIT